MKKLIVALALVLSVCCFAADISGIVIKVVDGDTFVLDDNGDKFRVRMAHIDAPESSQEFGNFSKTKLESFIYNRKVHVIFHRIDVFGRLVGEVYTTRFLGCNFSNVNQAMVACGAAYWFQEYSKDKTYGKLQAEAKQKKLGVWAVDNAEYPWDYRKKNRENK